MITISFIIIIYKPFFIIKRLNFISRSTIKISKCIYLLGEDSGNKGTEYSKVFLKDSEFIALSNKYLLFENKEGKVAISIKETEGVEGGASLCKVYSFDELSNEEKQAFIYPVECQEVRK